MKIFCYYNYYKLINNPILIINILFFRQIGAGIALRGHSGPVQAVSVLSREELVVSASHDNTMRAWRLNDYSCAAIYRCHNFIYLIIMIFQ